MVIIVFVFAVAQLRADEAKNNARRITYSEYIKTVTDTLPDIKKNNLQVDRAKNNLDAAYSSGDVNLTAGGYWSSTEDFSSQYTGSGSRTVTDYNLNAGVSKKFTGTGTTVEAGVAHDTIDTEGYGTKYYPSVYLKFSQSILKNAFGVVDRFVVNNAKMKYEIARIRQAENNKVALNTYKKLYFTWIEYSARLELLDDSIKYALIIEADTEKKYGSGLAGIEDLYNARALVAQYKINYEELLSQKSAVEAEIQVLIGSGVLPEAGEFEVMYDQADRFDYGMVPFSGTQNAEIYRLTRESYVYARDVNSNKLLPELDIVGKYTRKTRDDELSAAYTGLDKTDYYIGFSASYPLWNTEAESSVKESEIAIEEINTEYRITENAYKTNQETLIRQNESYRKMIALSAARIKSLEARYNTVYKKYRQGNQSLQGVIDALQDITTEKTVLFRYKSGLIQGYIDYSDLTR